MLFDEALQRYNEKQTRADRRIADYYDRQEVTEQLKAESQILWIQKMNNIWARAREIVEREFIYS